MLNGHEWSPDPHTLEQVALMLHALRDPNSINHKSALDTLNNETTNPTFILHLLEIFAHGDLYDGLPSHLRQLAGLIIKNYVFKHLSSLHESVFQLLKTGILQTLKDPLKDIRSTGGILIGRICDAFPFDSWSDIIQPLLSFLQSTNEIQIDGSLRAIQRMCEDACEKLMMDISIRPLEYLIPNLLNLFNSTEPTFRLRALESLNSLIFLVPSTPNSPSPHHSPLPNQLPSGTTPCAMITHMSSFLSGLSHLSSDQSPPVRRAVCQAIVLLASFQLAVLEPLLNDICTFMLQAIMDQDESVAMEACEYWWVLLEKSEGCEYLLHQHHNISPNETSFLTFLIQYLIARLPLTEAQIEYDRSEEEAEDVGDKEISFKPIHYRSRATNNSDHDDNDEDDDENDSGELSSLWTVRKEAARVLDIISCVLPTDIILPIALPILQNNLSSTNPWTLEAGILGLGTLSRGCSDDISQYLPNLLNFLLSCINGTVNLNTGCPPELRCVSAWVVGRYSYYWFENSEDRTYEDMTTQKTIITCLLETMHSPPPKLQAAICAALCSIFEAASNAGDPPPLTPEDHCISILHICLVDILQHIQSCFQTFGVKNTLLLCDTLATLCEAMDPLSLQATQLDNGGSLSSIFLPTLITKFYSVISQDSQPNIAAFANSLSVGAFSLHSYAFPVMECLTSVSRAVGRDIIPYAPNILRTCLHLINEVCDVYNRYETESYNNDNLPEPPSKDFVMCALDVIGGVMEGLEQDFSTVTLLSPGNEELQSVLVEQLLRCLCDNDSGEVRQSAFSLLGVLVSKCQCITLFLSPAIAAILSTSTLPTREDTQTNLTMNQSSSNIPIPVAFVLQLCLLNMETKITASYPLVASNAIWSLGEMIITLDTSIILECGPILANHILLLLKETINPSQSFQTAQIGWHDGTLITLQQNIAISLGRIAMMCPHQIVDLNQSFLLTKESLRGWFRTLKLVQYSSERDQAFYGVVAALNLRPQVLLEDNILIQDFVLACSSWDRPPGLREVHEELRKILLVIRINGTDGQTESQVWKSLLSRMDSNIVHRICNIFQLPLPSTN